VRALTADQMRDADASGVARVGDVALMRAAGERIAEAIVILTVPEGPLVAFAGPGNNGGDAFATFAALETDRPRIIYAMDAPQSSEARAQAEWRARERGIETRAFPTTQEAAEAALAGAGLALDALLGTGARPAPSEAMLPAIRALNAFSRSRVIAIDAPTGVDATTGSVASEAVFAGTTISLGAPKLGLLLEPARPYTGALYVADIGLAAEIAALPEPFFEVLTAGEFARLLPERGDTADKRSAGAPLVVAGSRQFPGAAVLCALGAARAGAGYVTVAVPDDAQDAVRAHLIEQVVVSYDLSKPARAAAEVLGLVNHGAAVALGPGLGLGDATSTFVRDLLAGFELPFVVDASGLFHLAKRLEMLRGKRCVVTPHAGEFARLSGKGTVNPDERIARLRAFTARTGITTLLKGQATLIDDGTTLHVNPTGTNALATAGTGDVLTGIIATLLAQGLSPVDAARAGAYWHGLAGQRAHAKRRVGVIARDLTEMLAEALDDAPAPLGSLQRVY
jgi:hydroxyethylthiazole kinase-like uncharacterized protein yjeF